MKKLKLTFIIICLLIIHIILFMVLLQNPKNNNSIDKKTIDNNLLIISNNVTGLKMKSSKTTIYTPSKEIGCIRVDRENRKTTKNFRKLTHDPYHGAIVIDAISGKILFEKHASSFCYPASVTKLMTLLITLEAIDRGEISKNDRIHINSEISGVGGSQLYLDPRETDFTVEDMLYGIMVHSANDAARALSIHIAGSKNAFVKLMNNKAKNLGMNSTIYYSEHGLPPEDDNKQPDISTPYDMALLALACLRHPETLNYTSKELIYLGKRQVMCVTRNALTKKIGGYIGCDGLKTGFIDRGGWSLIATASRNNQRIVSVVLGCKERDVRDSISRNLLDKGFELIEN